MFHDRGTWYDYDAWASLVAGDPEFQLSAVKWDWKGLEPWFRKSVTFTPPAPEVADRYGYTWNETAAWGGSSPIHASLSPFQWGDFGMARTAWREMGINS